MHHESSDSGVHHAAAAFDPGVSMKMARLQVANLDEARHKDPQATIDYLFSRKELYKRAASSYKAQAALAEQKYADADRGRRENEEAAVRLTRQVHSLKAKLRRESKMKAIWRFTAIGSGIGAFVLVAGVVVVACLLSALRPQQQQPLGVGRVPTSGTVQRTPNHVLASVNIFNGKVQGSGTVISRGKDKAAVLSAAHNFSGQIGGEFFVYYPDGTYARATLLAIDRSRDLAVASVDADTVLSHSYVPDKVPADGTLSGVGYTQGQGPNYRTLSYTSAYNNSQARRMWELNVTAGPFWDGDSGGGVFLDEATIGVTSQRDSLVFSGNNSYVRRMYACSHGEVVLFLNENRAALAGCGDWTIQPAAQFAGDGPPLWKPSPNIPIHVSEPTLRELKAEIEELKRRSSPPMPPKATPDAGLKRPTEVPK